MSLSLRDQLSQLGFKQSRPEPKESPRKPSAGARGDATARPADRRGPHAGQAAGKGRPAGKGQPGKPAGARPPRNEMDLGKAYALRAQKEKEERMAAERERQEAARLRREARAALAAFVAGRSLNAADAEIARHFEYGGKIKRIYVTAAQLRALNAGELGVLQNDGRYLLVDAETLAEAERIFAPAVALKVDPSAPAADDPYADPKFQVPDDLVW